jgi:NADH-quinone oxidoreductase subunit N
MNQFFPHLIALLPPIIVAITIVAVVLEVVIGRRHFVAGTITVLGLNAAGASLFAVLQVAPIQVTPLFVIDDYAVLYMALIIVSALACASLAYAYLTAFSDRCEEFYILLLCSVLGGLALVCSRHFASLFIGFELLSVPLFGMIAYAFRDRISLEGGFKYLVLSGVASSFLLFGMALLYAASGTLVYSGLANPDAHGQLYYNWLIVGVGMMVVGLGFKLSLVPFHMWTPDVYEGAPGPASTFLATVSKVAIFAVLLRFFTVAPPAQDGWLLSLIGVIAFLSMFVGNLLALRQNNIKRLLGYSAIAHIGYVLTAIVAGNGLAQETVGVYLATYVATSIGAFGVVTLVSSPYSGPDAADLRHYRGLFWRQPALAVILTVMMLSLAGIPLTVGFIGKFFAIAVAVQHGLWWLLGAIIAGSGIGLYYYLRVMVLLYLDAPEKREPAGISAWGWQSGQAMLVMVTVAVLFFGIYPEPLIGFVNAASMAGG